MQQHAIEVEHKGETIRGMVYRPASSKRFAAVLLLHGFTGSRVETGFLFVRLARLLAQRGIAAVTFDFRNSGESDGSFDQMLTSGELADTLRMSEWLQGQPFVDRSRLGLLGFSLGGLLAACTMARTNIYKSLVLLAPTTAQNITTNVCKRSNNCPVGEPVVIGPHVMHPKFIEDVSAFDPVADVVRHPRPTLLVQGTADTAVAPVVSQKFVDAMARAGVPCRHELIEGADHGFSNPAVRAKLLQVVPDWLVETLK